MLSTNSNCFNSSTQFNCVIILHFLTLPFRLKLEIIMKKTKTFISKYSIGEHTISTYSEKYKPEIHSVMRLA